MNCVSSVLVERAGSLGKFFSHAFRNAVYGYIICEHTKFREDYNCSRN